MTGYFGTTGDEKMTHSTADIQTIGFDDNDSTQKPLRVGFTIQFHPNIARIGQTVTAANLGEVVSIQLSRLSPLFSSFGSSPGMSLDSPHVSRTPIVITTDRKGGALMECPANVKLTIDALPAAPRQLLSAERIADGIVLGLSDTVVLLFHLFDPNVVPCADDLGMVGNSRKMNLLRSEILKVADLDTGVLIRGESGTGKELVAAAIQARSRRAGQVFEKVNIAEIPASIAERELFGAAKHAGTGEPGHEGYFLRADKGTLFLDEIGDLDPAIQPKLLRVLETGQVQILGSKRKETVNVRIIAGTDVDLEAAVDVGRFKSSLLQRLSAYPIHLAPLRERREDIGLLFIYFLKIELEKLGEAEKLAMPVPGKKHWLPAAFIEKLVLFHWPGNVRRLKNTAARAAIINRGAKTFLRDERLENMLEAAHSMSLTPASSPLPQHNDIESVSLSALSDESIVNCLIENDFNISKTVRALGVERAKFYRYLKKRGIEIESLRHQG